MSSMREVQLVGREALDAATVLLQRTRREHPTAGLYEAADLQWWWAQGPRRSDELPQLFWFDGADRPAAAVIATAWAAHVQLDPLVLPGAAAEWIDAVVGRGLAHARACGIDAVELEVDRADAALRGALAARGFAPAGGGYDELWLDVAERAPVSALAAGYRLASRADTPHAAHHMLRTGRHHPDLPARLAQMSLYRPDLDLVIHDRAGGVAAYALCWFDPTSATGLVEPVRTEDAHQRRGLARHLLTVGIGRLAGAGAKRVKICHDTANDVAGRLYRSVGFRPDRRTVLMAGATSPGRASPAI
jgi:GNAT superfamily N-acetyltransferase